MVRRFVLVLGLSFTAANAAQATELTVSAGQLPPHIDANGEGREAEIIRETLALCGHDVRFDVRPFTRHWSAYADDAALDAVATVPGGLDLPGVSAGAGYVSYQNGVSFLQSAPIDAATVEDLAGKRVVAFASARDILPGLDAAADSFTSYREVADQETQSRLLFSGRVDAVIGDGMIFATYNKGLIDAAAARESYAFDPSQPVSFSAIFDATPYSMRFRDSALAADFDRCLNDLRANGRVDEINRGYVDRYRETLRDQYQGY